MSKSLLNWPPELISVDHLFLDKIILRQARLPVGLEPFRWQVVPSWEPDHHLDEVLDQIIVGLHDPGQLRRLDHVEAAHPGNLWDISSPNFGTAN